MQGQSELMALTGQGDLNLLKEDCDMRFNVRVLGGWKGESKLIERLKQTAIPLRIYGKWQSLSYSLQVDQILRKQLQDEAKQRLNDWVERNKSSQDGKDVKKLLDKLLTAAGRIPDGAMLIRDTGPANPKPRRALRFRGTSSSYT
jgi:AsmA protein